MWKWQNKPWKWDFFLCLKKFFREEISHNSQWWWSKKIRNKNIYFHCMQSVQGEIYREKFKVYILFFFIYSVFFFASIYKCVNTQKNRKKQRNHNIFSFSFHLSVNKKIQRFFTLDLMCFLFVYQFFWFKFQVFKWLFKSFN